MTLRREPPAAPCDEFSEVQAPEISKLDRILLMLEAHEKLVDVDSENEIKFRGVLKNLRDSLKRVEDER